MSQAGSLDRRGFLAAGGAGALLCTVGGNTVPVSSPEDVARVDAVAASLPRPAAARRDPIDRAQFPTPGPPARRPAPRVLDRGAHGGLGHRADRARRVDEAPPPVAQAAQAARLRLPAVQRGLRRAARAPAHARADPPRRGRRRDRRPLLQPRPPAAPGGHHAPARGPLQPRVRRRLPRRLHARGGLRRRRARSSPTSGRRRPTPSASGPTTTTAPTTRSTRCGACSGR